jgi:hypothetical protein
MVYFDGAFFQSASSASLQEGGRSDELEEKRRRWTAAENLRVVLAGLDGSVEISEPCRREGINPTQYYGWKKQLLTSAAKRVVDSYRFVPFKNRFLCFALTFPCCIDPAWQE